MFYPPYVLQGHWRIPPFNTSLSSGVIPYQMSANPIVPISIALLIKYRTHRCVLGFHGDWWRIRLHSPLWSSYVRYLRQKGYFYTTTMLRSPDLLHWTLLKYKSKEGVACIMGGGKGEIYPKKHKKPCAVFNFSARPVPLFTRLSVILSVFDVVIEEIAVTIVAPLSRT